jgi:hypothetical protein
MNEFQPTAILTDDLAACQSRLAVIRSLRLNPNHDQWSNSVGTAPDRAGFRRFIRYACKILRENGLHRYEG